MSVCVRVVLPANRPLFTDADVARLELFGPAENSHQVMLLTLDAYRMLVAEGLLGEAHDVQIIDREATT